MSENMISSGGLYGVLISEENWRQCYFSNMPEESIFSRLNSDLNISTSLIMNMTCLFLSMGLTCSCHLRQKSWNSNIF